METYIHVPVTAAAIVFRVLQSASAFGSQKYISNTHVKERQPYAHNRTVLCRYVPYVSAATQQKPAHCVITRGHHTQLV
jgi:hypothetical protein